MQWSTGRLAWLREQGGEGLGRHLRAEGMSTVAMVIDAQLHKLIRLGNHKVISDVDQSRDVGEHSFLPAPVACFCMSPSTSHLLVDKRQSVASPPAYLT